MEGFRRHGHAIILIFGDVLMPLVQFSYTDKWDNTYPDAWAYIDFVALKQGERAAALEVYIYPSKAAADSGKPLIDARRIDITSEGKPAGDTPAIPGFADLVARIYTEYSALEAKLAELVIEVIPELSGATWAPVDPIA